MEKMEMATAMETTKNKYFDKRALSDMNNVNICLFTWYIYILVCYSLVILMSYIIS